MGDQHFGRVRACVFMCMCVYVRTYTCMYVRMYMYVCTLPCVCVYIYVRMYALYFYVFKYI